MIWWTLFVLVLAWFIKRTFFDPLKFWDQFGVKTKPGALPIVGHLWGIWKKHVFKEDLKDIQKLGKIFGTYEGNRPILVVADQEIIKELMITRFDQFTDRRDFLEPEPKYRRKILFLLHGQEWRIMRNVSSPFFSTGKIKQMSQVMTSCVDEVMQRIMTRAKEKGYTEVELKFTTMTLTIDVILRCVYGIAVPDLENPDSELMVQAKKAFAADELSSPFVMVLLLYPGLVAKGMSIFPRMLGMDSLRFFIHMGEKVMKQRESKGQLGNEFMDLLLKAQRQEKDNGTLEKHATKTTTSAAITEPVMTEEMIVAQCIQFLLAGFETTSSLLTTAMYSLTINPDVQEKLFQELVEKTEGGEKPIEHEILAECEYLDHVIKESLRLYPPVVRVERLAVTDTELGGIPIKKGQIVVVPLWAIQNLPENFQDPEVFDPDRWNESRKNEFSNDSWMPFGIGNRNCIGMRFGLEETKLALAKLTLKFQFQKTSNTSEQLRILKIPFQITPREVYVKLVPR